MRIALPDADKRSGLSNRISQEKRGSPHMIVTAAESLILRFRHVAAEGLGTIEGRRSCPTCCLTTSTRLKTALIAERAERIAGQARAV